MAQDETKENPLDLTNASTSFLRRLRARFQGEFLAREEVPFLRALNRELENRFQNAFNREDEGA